MDLTEAESNVNDIISEYTYTGSGYFPDLEEGEEEEDSDDMEWKIKEMIYLFKKSRFMNLKF